MVSTLCLVILHEPSIWHVVFFVIAIVAKATYDYYLNKKRRRKNNGK